MTGPVEAESDPDRGERVHHRRDDQIAYADHVIPEQPDRGQNGEEGKSRSIQSQGAAFNPGRRPDRARVGKLVRVSRRCTRRGLTNPPGNLRLAAFARQSPEDDVPEWRGDAVSVAVVLEVVAHVLLAQPL